MNLIEVDIAQKKTKLLLLINLFIFINLRSFERGFDFVFAQGLFIELFVLLKDIKEQEREINVAGLVAYFGQSGRALGFERKNIVIFSDE